MANYSISSTLSAASQEETMRWFDRLDSDMREAVLIHAASRYDNCSIENAVHQTKHEMTENDHSPRGYSASYKEKVSDFIGRTGAFRETVLAIAEKIRDDDCNGKPYKLPPIVYWTRVRDADIDYQHRRFTGTEFNSEKLDALCEQYDVEKYSVRLEREIEAEASADKGSGAGRAGR